MFSALSIKAQTVNITGVVSDIETEETLQGAKVLIESLKKSVLTDADGSFILENIEKGTYDVRISYLGYSDVYIEVTVDSDNVDVGTISLSADDNQVTDAIVVITDEDLLEGQSTESISGMLHGSRDVFLSTAGYVLGPLRFNVRGYSAAYTDITINGIPMENLESDYISWSNWGGLNNVTKNQVTTVGLEESESTFGNVGGTSNLIFRASKYRKGTNLTYSLLNKSYSHRLMATHSTGMMENGWAFTFSGSRRWAQEGYIEGTFYDAYSYFASIEKELNSNQTLNLVAFGASNRRGKSGASTQEVYDLLDNNHYNPYWGYQGGEIRNSRISHYHLPIIMLTHYWDINSTTKLETTASYKFGRGGSTALDWYTARDPRPDYYRNLPSYMNCTEEELAFITEQFINDPNYHQINWDRLYQINYDNVETIENAYVDGQAGQSVTGKRAQYNIEERRSDEKYAAFNTVLNKEINENIDLVFGAQFLDYKVHNYKTMVDLMGADFSVDVDKFAERDLETATNTDVTFNDIRYPNRIVYEGDIFGYDYISNTQKSKIWGQVEFDYSKFEFFVSAFGSYTSIWRTGNMQNGKFPDNSLGESDKNNFIDYGIKGGATYKISGRNYLYIRGGYLTNAPNFRNVYESPRTRDEVVDGITSEKIMSVDGGYALRAPRLKAAVNLYYTNFSDQTNIRSFYLDTYRNYINYIVKDIAKTHQGIELGIEAQITKTFAVSGVTSLGYYRYSDRPKVDIFVDNSSTALAKDQTLYLTGFPIDRTAQTVASIGLKYNPKGFWYFNLNGNYIDDRYLSFNMERRTSASVENLTEGSELYNETIDPIMVDPGYTIDFSVGKGIKITYDIRLNINFSVNNILDNKFVKETLGVDYKSLITGGYEQSRIDTRDFSLTKFPPKYYYNYGTTYYLNISLRF